jgi:cystathionine beta-lyase
MVCCRMAFDFDNPPDRRGTDSQKWQKYGDRDVIPLWVADMDFRSAPAIVEALHRRVDHGIFGYARPIKSTVESYVAACEARYGWKVDPSWIVWLPGLVVGLNVTARAFADAGEEILTFTPIYPPFMSAPRNGDRKPVTVPLALSGSGGAPGTARWEIDWDALERAVTPRTRVFFLCNPHNPVARVFRRDELARLGEFCARHNLVLCSDEIHCDLILDANLPHVVTSTLSPEVAARTITLMAPSKTYNVPGLGTSIAVIPDPALRARFNRAAAGIVAEVTTLGFAACEAAYRDCEPWRQELLAYLRGNRDHLIATIARDLPGVKIDAPIEATYLAWLNIADLKLPEPAAHFEKHGAGVMDGHLFGAERGKYVRLNFGCPRATLTEALKRMAGACGR